MKWDHITYTAGVTENKYSPKISTPPVLISWEISTPPVLISREICTPLGKKVLPRRALRDGKERNNLCPWRLKLPILDILYPKLYQKSVKQAAFSFLSPSWHPLRGARQSSWRHSNVIVDFALSNVLFCVKLTAGCVLRSIYCTRGHAQDKMIPTKFLSLFIAIRNWNGAVM